MIVTKDKTLIRGDILIDDNPEVRGVCPPAWRHLLFDRPFNRAAGGERITWANWRDGIDRQRPMQVMIAEIIPPIHRAVCGK